MMKLKLNRWEIISLIFLIVVIIFIASLVNQAFQRLSALGWSIETINSRLIVPLPNDATDIAYTGRLGRGGFLDLSFDVSPNSAKSFSHQFCGGILYQGYDPFNAVDSFTQSAYSVPIELDIYSYYSYSENTPHTVWGNRCLSERTGEQYQIRLDTSNQANHHIRLELKFGCTLCQISSTVAR